MKEETAASPIDDVMSMLRAGKHPSMDGAELAGSVFGVKLPFFSQRYLFNSSVFPVRQSVLLAGLPGTCKTSLMLYFMRLFLEQAGVGFVCHTEHKWPDDLPPSIIGPLIQRLQVIYAGSLQQWQAIFTERMKVLVASRDSEEGRKKKKLLLHDQIPILFGLDSLDAAEGEGRKDKISKSGSASRDYSEIALLNSSYLRDFTDRLSYTSAALVTLLHLKQKEDEMYTAGGAAKDFYASYIFYIVSASKAPQTSLVPDEGFQQFRIKCVKNSFGHRNAPVDVGMQWWHEDREGVDTQVTRFHWPEATADLLTMALTKPPSEGGVGKKSDLGKMFDGFRVEKHDINRYYCDALGLADLSKRQFGEALEGYTFDGDGNKVLDPTRSWVPDMLDKMFHIKQRKTIAEWFAEELAKLSAKDRAKIVGEEVAKGKKKKKTKAKAKDGETDVAEAEVEVPEAETTEDEAEGAEEPADNVGA